jgi:hypothetical protein
MKTLVTYPWRFIFCLVLQGHRECWGSEQHCHLSLCSVGVIIVSSETHGAFVYWMIGFLILQSVCHKRFISSPVMLYCTVRGLVEL